ncbi:MAG: hypothetical protein A3F90_06270 [Deltaproteobacteria bacterium RIFCSPLOWO2_12_FULL_60_19]|nr:MAG: hypothetical protein A3F90_06270 [Deltaproteobacteria bacterium RIFCSPLOWO2_12_FULL_60_19]
MKHTQSELPNKAVYGNQTFADGINRQEKTFKGHGAEQRRAVGRNEAGSSDFIAVQCQPCLCHGPNVSLSASDHDALRARRFQLEPFGQRSGHHAKSSAGVHKELNFFDMPGRTCQISLYVKKPHLKYLFDKQVYCTSDTVQRNSTDQNKRCVEESRNYLEG